MRRIALMLALGCAPAAPTGGTPGGGTPAGGTAPGTVAIVGATVIDMTGAAPKPGHTILIQDGRIALVGPDAATTIPAGTPTVDGRGRYVIPGLWDMHVLTSREGRARYFWPLFLAHGVTGVREMGSYLDTLLYWRSELRRNPAAGPRIVWSSPMLDGSPPAWKHGLGIRSPDEARTVVDSMRALGFDFLKVYVRLPRDVYAAIATRARELGIPFAGHVPGSITPTEAADAGQRSIEHLSGIYPSCVRGAVELRDSMRQASRAGVRADSIQAMERRLLRLALEGYDAGVCAALFQRFVSRGTWQVPTLVVGRGHVMVRDTAMRRDPRRVFVPSALAARWEADAARSAARAVSRLEFDEELHRRETALVGTMHRAGVRMLVGTDASDEPYVYAGSSVHDEMVLLAEAGLPPAAVLAAATVGPAEYLGLSDSLGTIEAGKAAELVVLDGDPLADISNVRRVHAVVSRGRVIGPAARDSLIALARTEAARAVPSPPAQQ